jgi:NADPH:quinone reductase-like Zn-dependent oxidoreductase
VRELRAFGVRSFGESPAVLELPVPSADDAFLVRVRFAGVNPIDYKALGGLVATSTYPHILGIDFAGVLELVPHTERDLHVGDRVFGEARTHGSYAEFTEVGAGAAAEPVVPIPDNVSDDQAAALPASGAAALGSLELLGVRAGQRVLVLGGAGAVGGYAVQIAHARGAHVIATVRGNPDDAIRLGADEVYDSKTLDPVEALRAAHPDGIDAILDPISDPGAIRREADILRAGGNIVSTLGAADESWFAERHIHAQNITAVTNPFNSAKGLSELARMLAGGIITARISASVDLKAAGDLLERLRSGGLHGKAVIRI